MNNATPIVKPTETIRIERAKNRVTELHYLQVAGKWQRISVQVATHMIGNGSVKAIMYGPNPMKGDAVCTSYWNLGEIECTRRETRR